MFTNVLWVALYIALVAAVGGAAYYIGDDRGEERGRKEAALSEDETRYFDAGVATLAQLGYTWDGSAWAEPSATPEPAGGGSTTASLPDRTSCSEINGTPYRSPSERTFFLTSCLGRTVTPTPLCGGPPNPWCYDLFPGDLITSPPGEFCGYFECVDNFWVGTGYVIRCVDGTYSKAGGTPSACTGNGGVLQPLYSH
jgi:hypothetical protein